MCHKILLFLSLSLLALALALSPAANAGAVVQAADFTATLYLPLASSGNPGGDENGNQGGGGNGCSPKFDFIASDDEANEQAVFEAMNEQRAANGVAPLTFNGDLTQSSRLHSRDMADNNFTEHAGTDGSDGGARIALTCYGGETWGENIGWGYDGDVEQMMAWWMQSPLHREAILNPDFHDVGVGYAVNAESEWGSYWTVNFGARR